ncbi:type VI secretion system baseplate subunit TssF [Corallincola platygyrae]|uniref:Type VI secretion system baseplate subunit TssF n=1 Tax=Corallincola platygyrae TaxID=1193278 RepID=A0ABW4XKN7_9GAMM
MDSLLKYYNRELAFLRHSGADFAKRYPKVAGRLNLSDETAEDPHVSRLLEGFALLTAQIRQRLDEGYPELANGLLGQLMPDFHAPIPSMSVVELTTKNLTDSPLNLTRGAEVKMTAPGYKECRFRTCYDTQVYPLILDKAQFINAPFKFDCGPFTNKTRSILRLSLRAKYDNVSLSTMSINTLRLFLNGIPQLTYPLAKLLHQGALGAAIVCKANGHEKVKYLQKRHITVVGFKDEEQLIPYSKQSFSAFRLLAEHFTFPQKFLFFDIEEMNPDWWGDGSNCDLVFFFEQPENTLAQQLSRDNVRLGCVPVVNLYDTVLEPIEYSEAKYEYQLKASYEDQDISEVVKVNRVTAHGYSGQKQPIYAFYQENILPETDDAERAISYWRLRREFSQWAGGYTEPGMESYLSIVGNAASPLNNTHKVIEVEALCCNRNLPSRLPFGADSPRCRISERADVIEKVTCLVAPTATYRKMPNEDDDWQLVQHLSLNDFSGNNGAELLQTVLRLYDYTEAAENRTLIKAITGVTVKPTTARVLTQGRAAICSGSDVEVEMMDDELFGSQIFLFGTVLSNFFSQFAHINSFTRLTIKLRDQKTACYSWGATSGGRPLL